MSQLKNGGLARIAQANTVKPSSRLLWSFSIKFVLIQIISFILSDVIGGPLEFIASGPTFYNGNKAAQTIDIFQKYDLFKYIPIQFARYLKERKNDGNEQTMSVHCFWVG